MLDWKKDWLNSYRYIKKEHGYYLGELEELQERKLGLTRVLSGMPSGNGTHKGLYSVWDRLIDKTDDTLERLAQITGNLDTELERIHYALDKLPPPERMVLTARHVRGMAFKDILKEIDYSERTMYTLYNRGLEMIECPFVVPEVHSETEGKDCTVPGA